jgi:hypothetical protein
MSHVVIVSFRLATVVNPFLDPINALVVTGNTSPQFLITISIGITFSLFNVMLPLLSISKYLSSVKSYSREVTRAQSFSKYGSH